MDFVLNRNHTIASTTGHSVQFQKGVPVHVPPCMYREVRAIGAESVEAVDMDPEVKTDPADPTDPDERKIALFTVFEKITLRSRRGDFTGAGAPHQAVLKQELGWEVGNKERDAAWIEFKVAAKNAGK